MYSKTALPLNYAHCGGCFFYMYNYLYRLLYRYLHLLIRYTKNNQ